MSENWGPGVSRTLLAAARQFRAVVWQDGGVPLDSEHNLAALVGDEQFRSLVRSQVHSGFLTDPARSSEDYGHNPLYANQFLLGPSAPDEVSPVLVAAVNGWMVPVVGTALPEPGGSASPANRIRLAPPPTTDSRTDFVFLEVWQALVSTNPSTANKPSAGYLWKWGNVEHGSTNLEDDLLDPEVGFETTKRIQVQYRLRVVGSGDAGGVSIDLLNYPEGLDDPQVLAQGTASEPQGGMAFTNMRAELGDPSLWRAGDGNPSNTLGTVDGYVYAIPVCAVFRRNASPFTAVEGAGTPNQNGASERTPSSRTLSSPRDGARTLTRAALLGTLSDSDTGYVSLTGMAGSALNDPELFPGGTVRRYLVVGTGINREVIAINYNSDPAGHPNDIFIDATGRGRAGTQPRTHVAGTPVALYNSRPDGLYADEVAPSDILDMRRSVCAGDWDYDRLLHGGLAALVQNRLRTTFKQAGSGGDTTGTVTTEVSYLQAPAALGTPPLHVDVGDGPDGIRTVWSDSAAVQRDVTVALNPDAPLSSGRTATTFDVGVASSWGVGADFTPWGFVNNLGAGGSWTDGSVIFLNLGGADGVSGARKGLVGGQKAVRFVSPRESWAPGGPGGNEHPWRLRFLGGAAGNSAGDGSTPSQNGYRAALLTSPAATGESSTDHPGPLYPDPSSGWERPFIVLGGVLHPSLYLNGVPASADSGGATFTTSTSTITLSGLNFDTFSLPLGRNGRSLRDYLTNDGQDSTGASSQLYLVVYGDQDSKDNNGAFKVVGAGTAAATGGAYTQHRAATAHGLVVEPLSAGWSSFTNNASNTVTVEFRSQEINAEDDAGKATPPAGVAVVFTDLAGAGLKWGEAGPGTRLHTSGSPPLLTPLASKAVLTMDLLWSPNRGSSMRVPDRVLRVAARGGASTWVRNTVSSLDSGFVSDTGYPAGDRVFDPVQIQLWNRLGSLGLDAPEAPRYGGSVVGLTEQDRESEVFLDPGSKTLLFRPLILKYLMLKGLNTAATPSLVGALNYPPGGLLDPPKDPASIWTSSKTLGYAVPPEFMPRFGRQDIPYHVRTSSVDPILPGINHLFADTTDASSPVFYVIGGENNAGPAGTASVRSILFASSPLPYGQAGTVGGAPHAAYGARKVYLPQVVSSDLGVGMWGVELPPYTGVARLYGVYELNDFLANLDPTYIGAFQNDRITPVVGSVSGASPANLLRSNATRQTLFIRQGGANDATGLSDSHTYIVPDSAIDISAVPGYTGSETFDSYEYVVECVVFGFGEGFINRNNFVLARRSSGTAVAVTDSATPELLGVGMVVPSAAPAGDALYTVYERTVYQGDPYQTRGGSSAQGADYAGRYGQLPQASAYQLATPIQQFSSTSGEPLVLRPNARALEVVAGMDFYTTLGTGKIGGKMWPGTPLDCGCVEPEAGSGGRIPGDPAQLPWRVVPRAFTAGQGVGSERASLRIQLVDYTRATGAPNLRVSFSVPSGTYVAVGGTDFGSGALSVEEATASLAAWVNSPARALARHLEAVAVGDQVYVAARIPGTLGNSSRVSLATSTVDLSHPVTSIARLLNPQGNPYPLPFSSSPGGAVTSGRLIGGANYPVNAGNGDSVLSLAGMTERLPLGILAQDSDFLGESILGDNATSFCSFSGGIRSVYSDVPLTRDGCEYTRFLGEPGAVLALSDGACLRYVPYTDATPSGTRVFRIFRGGGAAYMLSGSAPGGPLTWISESFPPALRPVLKGAVLAGRVLLVRNFHEEAFGISSTRSEGDEIQMLVMTQVVYGSPYTTSEGLTLGGVISPTGYGEGYAAADRFRLPGRPMDRGRTRTRPPAVDSPAPYFPQE